MRADIQKDQMEYQVQAKQWAEDALEAIVGSPADYSRHVQILYDLKKKVVDHCAESYGSIGLSSDDLRWDLISNLPEFSTETLYQKRTSWFSLAGIIIIGYLLGGVLATILDWFSLGGDIIRVFMIWALCWSAEYLASHPKARTRVLGALGLGALGKFSLDLIGGMLSFSSWTSVRGAIFGGLSVLNPFKRFYLLLGAGVLFVLLSKKVVSLDTAVFREDLQKQLEERIRLLRSFFEQMAVLKGRLIHLEGQKKDQTGSDKCPRNDCPLALSLIDMLAVLPEDSRRFLAENLAMMGYTTAVANGSDDDVLVWDSKGKGSSP